MEVKKAVITSGGRATRMKYISNSIPKALLPLFTKEAGIRRMRPAVDFIVNSLEGAGADDICIVMGSKAKPLADYFFEKSVTLVFQNEARGFGDAVLQAENFVGNKPFFVNADDSLITGAYKEASQLFSKMNADCVLFLQRTKTPSIYGIVSIERESEFAAHKVFRITGAEEKPKKPKSDLAICGTYIFSPSIFTKLKEVRGTQKEGELQLTSGFEKIIEDGGKIYGILLKNERWMNVGDPESYYEALKYSYENL